MGEVNYDSAGVFAKEIDLSGPTVLPVGEVPAGVIGTAKRGPAFVPVTVLSLAEFESKFGSVDGTKYGPLAVAEWLRYARSATYVRVLGVGDGTKRTTSGNNQGRVARAGFVVGDQLPSASGSIEHNPYAVAASTVKGRTYFLGCFMSESVGSTIFSDALVQGGHNQYTDGGISTARSMPIIRAVLMAPSGVTVLLSGSTGAYQYSNAPHATASATAAGVRGMITGTVSGSNNEFVLLLNGYVDADGLTSVPRVITASFNVGSANYFANVLNRDPIMIQRLGHFMYAHYDVPEAYAVVTGSGITNVTASNVDVGFIVSGVMAQNSGTTTVPNYEGFEDRYTTPRTPWFISQKFGSTYYDLFKVHALDDGDIANDSIKVSIMNIRPSTSEKDEHGTFSLIVRKYSDTDAKQVQLERWDNLSLDPHSDRYVAAVIGDQRAFFDFDRNVGSQRSLIEGSYPNASSYIRIEPSDDLKNGRIDATALPIGFRGHGHLITSGSGLLANSPGAANVSGNFYSGQTDVLNRALTPPVPFRQHLVIGTGLKKLVSSDLHWGVQFERKVLLNDPNANDEIDPHVKSHTLYFPSYHTSWQNPWVENNAGKADSGGVVYDVDRFNQGRFTLENVKVVTASNGDADPTVVADWVYVRTGNINATEAAKSRAFTVNDLKNATVRKYMKFTTFLQGGFNGVNIFNTEATQLSNTAAKWDMDYTPRGQRDGATVMAYRKALEIMGSTADVDVKLLAIPGIRHSTISDDAITTVENRFDALYIMDIEERDQINVVVTASAQTVNVANTVDAFKDRAVDSNFAASYFPDVTLEVASTKALVRAPPSVAVLGAYALNDAVAFPWFAPAGLKRGVLKSTKDVNVRLNKANLDTLYAADINPIVSFPGSNDIVIWGQKTLQAAQSSLDRVNVRRLLIEIRRQVRSIANSLLFEPNRDSTLARFSAEVTPKLKRIQERSGLDRFKVQIDTTTTTQADVENNTIRGKIFVQPTKTAEFISLDFVVTNAGANV